MCIAALGTDTGGSVRVPAALCGLTGLRPAPGRISTQGVVPMSWTLDTVGPLARSAADIALLLESMEIGSPPPYSERLHDHPMGLRLGVPEDDFFWQDTAIEVVGAVRAAIDGLSDLGLHPQDVSLPMWQPALISSSVISLGDAAAFHRERLESEPERFGADVRARLEWGMERSAADYARARQLGRAWDISLRTLFRDRIDVLATPTTPSVVHPIASSEGIAAARELLRFTYPVSLGGMPALSLPCGFTADGVPIGMQLIAREAETLLRVAHAYQQATDWHKRHPGDPDEPA
jgi:aspartyl-tRNA(Asn)/glutamyl-tRNA(Gln) amidotransferase subunit A